MESWPCATVLVHTSVIIPSCVFNVWSSSAISAIFFLTSASSKLRKAIRALSSHLRLKFAFWMARVYVL